jgi:exopolyphosphatase/guanosine-5'-triphosphate,3'-diphosphate pyrophosphatase
MRVAALDIGSNSVRLLIARGRAGRLVKVASYGATTRLAEGFGDGGAFKPQAVARTAAAARQMVQVARRHGVSSIRAVATGVLRSTRGADAVLELIEEAAGVPVEVLSGPEEGRLCLRGAWPLVGSDPVTARLVDVGGGSTELVEGTPWSVDAALSLPLGCVTIAERFLRSDPPDPAEVIDAKGAVAHQLAGLALASHEGDVIATGGTATSLVSLELSLRRYSPRRVHGSQLDREQLAALVTALASMTLSQRRRLHGLSPDRADIIVGGAIILWTVLERWGADRYVVSDRGLRHGIVMELLGLEGCGATGEPFDSAPLDHAPGATRDPSTALRTCRQGGPRSRGVGLSPGESARREGRRTEGQRPDPRESQ